MSRSRCRWCRWHPWRFRPIYLESDWDNSVQSPESHYLHFVWPENTEPPVRRTASPAQRQKEKIDCMREWNLRLVFSQSIMYRGNKWEGIETPQRFITAAIDHGHKAAILSCHTGGGFIKRWQNVLLPRSRSYKHEESDRLLSFNCIPTVMDDDPLNGHQASLFITPAPYNILLLWADPMKWWANIYI